MIAQYIEYFKTVAINHPLLLHNETAGERSFFAIDFPELLGSFKNGIREKGVALYALNYQSRFQNYNVETVEGGFVVMSYFNKNLKGSKQGVYDMTEAIVYQIIARLQHDSNQLHPLWLDSFMTLDSFEKVAYKYQAKNDYIGWLVTFQFKHVHNMSNYVANYLPPAIDASPVFTEGWIYLLEGLGVYKWTQPKTKITIDASSVMGQYSTIKIQDILNEWTNSLKNLSDTFWSIEGHLLTIRFTEVQQGSIWIAGTSEVDRFSYPYQVEEVALSTNDDTELTDNDAVVFTVLHPEGYFLIDFSQEINVPGDDIEIKIYNSVGDEIPATEYEYAAEPSRIVKIWLDDPAGDNATGTIYIRVIP